MFQDAVPNAVQPVAHAGQAAAAPPSSMLAWNELGAILVRRAAWIIGAVAVALVAALLLVALLPPTYTANTQVVVQPTDLKAVDGSVNQAPNQPDTSVALVETAARVIQSTKVLGQVVDTLGLARDPEFARRPSHLRELVGRVQTMLGTATNTPATDPVEDAVQRLGRAVMVRRSERTFVIDLSVKSEDPAKAARIANAIVGAFLDVQAAARAEASRRISDALSSRLGEMRDKLRRSEDAAQNFKVANNLVVANGQLVNEQQLSEASNQLSAAENRTADAKAKLDQVATAAHDGDPGAIPESLQSQTITALRSQLAQVSKQEADARATFGGRHPQLTQIKSQVEAVRRALDGEVQRIRDAARGEYDRARTSEASLRASLVRQQVRGTQANAAEIRLRELQRDADASRSVYEAFLVRARETAEQERVDTLNAWVMSPATPPSDRSFPPPNLVVFGAALVAGLAVGIAGALLRERLDPRLWSPGRAEAVTGVPVVVALDGRRRRPAGAGRSGARPFPDDDRLQVLVQDLMAGRSAALGRIVLLLGARYGAETEVAAQQLATASAAEGFRTTLVRFDTGEGPAGKQPSADDTRASGYASSRQLRLREPDDAGEAPVIVERLKACLANSGGGLLIVAARRTSPLVPQLAALADSSLLVLARARSTRGEALAMAQRLRSKAGALRGAILVRGAR